MTWDKTGNVISQGTCRGREEFEDFLESLGPVPVVIVEDFTLFKNKALQQSGSKMETVRVIGSIESWSRRNKSLLKMQPASTLAIAQLWSGMKMPKNHKVSHWVSAYNHGFYYLVKAGVRKLELRPD